MPTLGNIAVTGYGGFVGRYFTAYLQRCGYRVKGIGRTPPTGSQPDEFLSVDLTHETVPPAFMEGCEAVVHLAARAHIVDPRAAQDVAGFTRVNVAGTQQLARNATAAGVRRFIFLSSIGVCGPQTKETPFTEATPPAPVNPYTRSKHDAETALLRELERAATAPVIVRAPLVFGPNPPGNLRNLLSLVERGIPLPFGAVHNQRSLVSLENLSSLLVTTISHERAAGELFLVADQDPVSTPDIIRAFARGMSKPPRLLSLPPAALKLGLRCIGRSGWVDQLLSSLVVDTGKARQLLKWHPRGQTMQMLTEVARGHATRRTSRQGS